MRLYMSHLWNEVQDEMVDEKTFTTIAWTLFRFLVKDNKIPDIFYKFQKSLGAPWASVIAHKDILDLIIWT